MLQCAARIPKVFPSAVIVMGHTHTPVKIGINGGETTYFNVGSWAEEEGDDGKPPADESYRAARAHLVVHSTGGRPVAEFRQWDGNGPRPYSPP